MGPKATDCHSIQDHHSLQHMCTPTFVLQQSQVSGFILYSTLTYTGSKDHSNYMHGKAENMANQIRPELADNKASLQIRELLV